MFYLWKYETDVIKWGDRDSVKIGGRDDTKLDTKQLSIFLEDFFNAHSFLEMNVIFKSCIVKFYVF